MPCVYNSNINTNANDSSYNIADNDQNNIDNLQNCSISRIVSLNKNEDFISSYVDNDEDGNVVHDDEWDFKTDHSEALLSLFISSDYEKDERNVERKNMKNRGDVTVKIGNKTGNATATVPYLVYKGKGDEDEESILSVPWTFTPIFGVQEKGEGSEEGERGWGGKGEGVILEDVEERKL